MASNDQEKASRTITTTKTTTTDNTTTTTTTTTTTIIAADHSTTTKETPIVNTLAVNTISNDNVTPPDSNSAKRGKDIVGPISCVRFWLDNWLGDIIADRLNMPDRVCHLYNQPISRYYVDGRWQFVESFCVNHWDIVEDVTNYPIVSQVDSDSQCPRDKTQKPFTDVAAGLKIGEISDTIDTNEGVYRIMRTG